MSDDQKPEVPEAADEPVEATSDAVDEEPQPAPEEPSAETDEEQSKADTESEEPETEEPEPEAEEPEAEEPEAEDAEAEEPEAEDAEAETEAEEAATPAAATATRRRNWWRLPNTRSQLSVAVLCALLGFAAVVQVRSLDETSTLQGARQSDLIRILDDVTDRSKRLQDERAQLEATKQELISGTDRAKTALQEAQKRAETLGILAGTLPAHGPGIQLTIVDPERRVDAPVLLNTLQELRDAGAEAVQINDVRVVAGTDLLDASAGAVRVDGREVRAPYIFRVIGDPDTLTAALGIPGGVFAELQGRGAEGLVDKREDVEIDALRPVERPQYARPARDAGSR